MYDFTNEELEMITAGDFYHAIPNLPLEVLEQIYKRIGDELRERDLAIKENA